MRNCCCGATDSARSWSQRGLRVIRYDNRDVGLSSKLDGQRVQGSQYPRMVRSFLGRRSRAVYTLEDMADDAAAVLDHLGVDNAHIVGRLDGRDDRAGVRGTARHPDRLAGRDLLQQQPGRPAAAGAAGAVLGHQGPAGPGSPREVIIDNAVRVTRIIGSPGYPAPEDRIRAEAAEAFDRSYYPVGIARQFGAILGSGSLRRYDRRITAPTVVIHGLADKLMRPAGGRAVAETIRGARLVLFPGMGHELPEALWDQIVAELDVTFAAGKSDALDSAS